jgi:hypothetical protein
MMNDKQIAGITTLTAMLCLSILGCAYLATGHNSIGFATITALIAGLAGYIIPSPLQKNHKL